MSTSQNFRSAFHGFNREDVVHYLEYLNSKHTVQVNQLTAENEELRSQLNAQPEEDLVQSLQDQCEQLRSQLAEAQARVAELEQAQAAPQEAVQPQPKPAAPAQPVSYIFEELETYRRAERIEREARERAEFVYYQATGVLTSATDKVDALAEDITTMTNQVMDQLSQLQLAVTSSKQALQEASAVMHTIRPSK